MEWEFSYLDLRGNFRGPFCSDVMQKWYEKGYLCADLKMFIHRGHIADISTLGELLKRNGERTPFIFSSKPKDIVIHRGFVEFPPGIKVMQKSRQQPTKSSNGSTEVVAEVNPTVSQGDQKIAVIRPLSSENPAAKDASSTTQGAVANVTTDVPINGMTISKKEVSSIVARTAKPWPLLSRPDKNHPRTKRRVWIKSQFKELSALLKNADLTKLNSAPENRDLRGAVCKFCYVELAAASDVMRHLTLIVHQERVIMRCQVVGTEFDDYKKRLQNAAKPSTPSAGNALKLSAETGATSAESPLVSKSTTTAIPTSAAKTAKPSEAPKNTSKVSATTALSVKTYFNSRINSSLMASVKTPLSTKEDTDTEAADVPHIKLMQSAPTSSRLLTDEEYETKMQELRKLSHKIDTRKFMAMYKDRIISNYCHICRVKSEGPTTMLAHYVSQRHCEKVRSDGILPREDDVALWKIQILACIPQE